MAMRTSVISTKLLQCCMTKLATLDRGVCGLLHCSPMTLSNESLHDPRILA